MALKTEKVIKAAEKYVAKGKLEAAIKEYRKVLAENPNDTNTLNRVGDLYARLERYDEAVKLFTQIAEKYTRDGFFLKAIAIYKKIIKLDPTALAVYERLAELYHRQGLLNEARTQYQVLAEYYQKHENATSAITIYQRMSEIEPDNPTFHLKLAELYASQRLTDKALKEYQALVEVMLDAGSAEETVAVYAKAIELAPDNLDFIRQAVKTLHEKEHVGVAAKVLARATELNPKAEEVAAEVGLGPKEPEPEPEAAPEPEPTPEAQAPFEEASSTDAWSTEPDFDAQPGYDPEVEEGVLEIELDDDLSSAGTIAVQPAAEPPAQAEAAPPDSGDLGFDGEGSHTGLYAEPDQDFGGGDEAFTLDLDDDEVPDTQVLPPDDVTPAAEPVASGAQEDDLEFEFEVDLEASADDLTVAPAAVAPIDESEIVGPEFDDMAEAAPEPSAPEPAPRQPAAGGFEIEWSMDELEVPSLEEQDIQPVAEVEPDTQMPEAAPEPPPQAMPAPPPDAPPAAPPPAAAQSFEVSLGDETMPSMRAEPPAAPAAPTPDFDATIPAGSAAPTPAADPTPAAAPPPAPAQAPPPPADAPPAVRREEDLVAEAKVFAKYGLREKALDRLNELLGHNPANLSALALRARLDLEGGDIDSAVDYANMVAGMAQQSGDLEAWKELQAEFEKAGYPVSDGGISSDAPEQKAPGQDDRIAQLLEDLSLESFEGPAAPSPGASPVDSLLSKALGSSPPSPPAVPSVDAAPAGEPPPGPPAGEPPPAPPPAGGPPVEEPAPPAASSPQLFSLADELSLDDEDETVIAPSAAAASDGAAAMDETGMSWLDEPTPSPDSAAAPVGDTIFDDEDDFFDLAAELEEELGGDAIDEVAITSVEPQEQSLEEIIEGFKQGVAENLSSEDYDTHFNLGIAYREMGLLDEAIGEFQLASKDPRYLVECASMLGICFFEKGLTDLAVRWYQKGLAAPDISEESTLGLLYDLGTVYESVGDSEKAYKTFIEIYGLNTNFRDVSQKIQELSPQQT